MSLLNCYFYYEVETYDEDEMRTEHFQGVLWATCYKKAAELVERAYNDSLVEMSITALDSDEFFEFNYNHDILEKAGFKRV